MLYSPKKESSASTTPVRSSKRGSSGSNGTPGMVNYKGAMLDISSVMARLEKSEKTKRDTEAKLKDTQEDMGK